MREAIEKALEELYRKVDTTGSPEPEIKLEVLVPRRIARRILAEFRAAVIEECAQVCADAHYADRRDVVSAIRALATPAREPGREGEEG